MDKKTTDNLTYDHRFERFRSNAASEYVTKPKCLWLTGLSGSGKSTLADHIKKALEKNGVNVYVLDGDNIRHGLNSDLGFTAEDRKENIRRIAEVAKLMVNAGIFTIVAAISPFRNDRDMARKLFSEGEFIEVFVDAPLEECERRDPKGLYARARAGDISHFTGIDSPYETPSKPEAHLNTNLITPEAGATLILEKFVISV